MKYTFNTPVTVGDFNNPKVVDGFELASISINFESFYADKGEAAISVVLHHKGADFKHNVVHTTTSVLDLWNKINAGDVLTKAIFDHLVAEGKLPAGTITP